MWIFLGLNYFIGYTSLSYMLILPIFLNNYLSLSYLFFFYVSLESLDRKITLVKLKIHDIIREIGKIDFLKQTLKLTIGYNYHSANYVLLLKCKKI